MLLTEICAICNLYILSHTMPYDMIALRLIQHTQM